MPCGLDAAKDVSNPCCCCCCRCLWLSNNWLEFNGPTPDPGKLGLGLRGRGKPNWEFGFLFWFLLRCPRFWFWFRLCWFWNCCLLFRFWDDWELKLLWDWELKLFSPWKLEFGFSWKAFCGEGTGRGLGLWGLIGFWRPCCDLIGDCGLVDGLAGLGPDGGIIGESNGLWELYRTKP